MPDPQPTNESSDRVAQRAVAGAMTVTVLLLFIMMVGSFNTSRALGSMNEENALHHRCLWAPVVVGSSLSQ